LHSSIHDAIVPPHLLSAEEARTRRVHKRRKRLALWVRMSLALMAVFLVAGFSLAAWLNPYKDGRVWLEETHRQLGLPPCTFRALTGMPCPSCGMTSSFALLMHGDLGNSLRANFAGTALAVFFMALVPWCLVCSVRGKVVLVRSWDWVLVRIVLVFLVLLLLRWGMVLLLSSGN
jgi:hypothetical protein